MTKQIISLMSLLLVISISFAQNKAIYTNPDFSSLANGHQELAILPFKANIELRPKQMKQMTPEEFADLQKSEGLAVQNALQSYFLRKKGQKGFTVTFQDVNRTNALLAKNGVTPENVHTYLPEELSEMLGVDGVIHGTLNTSQPLSNGAAVALQVFTNFAGPTNMGTCTISVSDGATGKLLWRYEKSLSRGLGSDTNTIITTIMRKAARKFPYSDL